MENLKNKLEDNFNEISKDNYSVFTYAVKNENKNLPRQFISGPARKINRNFINLINTRLSNKHCNGLYNYSALVANALSNNILYTAEKRKFNSCCFVRGNIKFFEKLFGFSDFDEIDSVLMHLKELDLIDIDIDNASLNAPVHCRILDTGISTSISSKSFLKAESAAIRKHFGYFYINQKKIDKIIDSSSSFSECDMAIDLYTHIVYNDEFCDISKDCPIVIFRNKLKKQYITTRFLAKRWKISIGKVNQFLQKLKTLEIIDYKTVPNYGTYIFFKSFSKENWNIESNIPSYFDILKITVKNYEKVYINYFYKKYADFIKNKKSVWFFLQKIKNCSICYRKFLLEFFTDLIFLKNSCVHFSKFNYSSETSKNACNKGISLRYYII